MKYFFLLMLASGPAIAQSPQVPHKMQFAGMTLTIREDARREIQKDVDALTQSPKHFMIKVERARTYFPIIEKVFAEERLPEDFKYLVLQESALIPDAVSVSNAVGFWQFKDFTAEEVGLRVDKEVDERMNIVSSSRGAARYLKKNNFFFNNWLYALQAYQMGAGGVMQTVKEYHSGARQMEVTGKTYWYVKKYLAHKVAFEGAVEEPGTIQIAAYESNGKSDLKQFANEYAVNEEELQDYNKWIRKGHIPDDKVYAVIVPLRESGHVDNRNHNPMFVGASPNDVKGSPTGEKNPDTRDEKVAAETTINGLIATKARPGESATALASRLGIKKESLIRYNDMSERQKVEAGQYYFASKKRSRSQEAFHKVEPGEDLWSVSQQYGIRLKKLRRFNRLEEHEKIEKGTMLYLASRRPRNDQAQPLPADVLEVDKTSLFSWSVDPSPKSATQTSVEDSQEAIVIAKGKLEKHEETPATDREENPVVEDPRPDPINVQTSETGDATPPSQETEAHVVMHGETLYAIAKTYGVTVTELMEWNDITEEDPIREGQVLALSSQVQERSVTASGPSHDSTVLFHEVKASDTLYSVARKYGVTIKEIMDWNGKSDFNLNVGERLKIIR